MGEDGIPEKRMRHFGYTQKSADGKEGFSN